MGQYIETQFDAYRFDTETGGKENCHFSTEIAANFRDSKISSNYIYVGLFVCRMIPKITGGFGQKFTELVYRLGPIHRFRAKNKEFDFCQKIV